MNIVHIFSDSASEYNSSGWRGKLPCAALNRVGHMAHMPHVDGWFKNTDYIKAICAQADLIIIQRVLVEEGLARIAYWRERKKPVVCDFDDSYGLLQSYDKSGNQAARFWREGQVEIKFGLDVGYFKTLETHPLQQFVNGARMCSGLSMPSKILAEDWQWVNKCYYIPNYIDSGRYLPHKRTDARDTDNLIIGYGGSMSHVPSFRDSGVLEAIKRVFQKRKSVKFLLAGDERLYKMLPIPESQKIFQHYVTAEDWPKVLRKFDIGIAPLHSRYDHSRSYIKSSEYSLMGIPFVATGCPTYEEWQARDIGVYVSDGPEGSENDKARRTYEWEVALLDMIDNYPAHKAKIDSQFDIAMEYDVDRNVGKIVATYEEIIKRG